ncbi:hypothetical protein BJY54_000184 [Streptomyces nodosus]|nr:hypothetical protein [Streptomyces nodosus]
MRTGGSGEGRPLSTGRGLGRGCSGGPVPPGRGMPRVGASRRHRIGRCSHTGSGSSRCGRLPAAQPAGASVRRACLEHRTGCCVMNAASRRFRSGDEVDGYGHCSALSSSGRTPVGGTGDRHPTALGGEHDLRPHLEGWGHVAFCPGRRLPDECQLVGTEPHADSSSAGDNALAETDQDRFRPYPFPTTAARKALATSPPTGSSASVPPLRSAPLRTRTTTRRPSRATARGMAGLRPGHLSVSFFSLATDPGMAEGARQTRPSGC